MPTPNKCKADVPQINPKTNNIGLAAAGTSIPWAIPWNKPKIPTKIIIKFFGIFLSILIPNPKRITEKIIPTSTKKNSSINKKNPNNPPTVIIVTNVVGTVQIALPPIWADTIPTLIIARKWSKPKTGWEIPS